MSRSGDGALEDFKARLPLVDIVARHVRLIRRGNRLSIMPVSAEHWKLILSLE